MTREQHLRLEKYEHIFRTAIDALYIRAMDSRFAAEFISICHDLNIYINPSCPACVLKAALILGKLYFEYVEPETPKTENIETIKKEKKVSLSVTKQPKKKKSK